MQCDIHFPTVFLGAWNLIFINARKSTTTTSSYCRLVQKAKRAFSVPTQWRIRNFLKGEAKVFLKDSFQMNYRMKLMNYNTSLISLSYINCFCLKKVKTFFWEFKFLKPQTTPTKLSGWDQWKDSIENPMAAPLLPPYPLILRLQVLLEQADA